MMKISKRIYPILILPVLGFLGLVISCDDRLDDLRDNPNAVTSIDDAALFAKGVRDLFLETTSQSASRFGGHYGHYFVAGTVARFPDLYGDGFDGNYNGMYRSMYGTIRHIEEVLVITSTPETENSVRHAMADIITVLGFAKITDAYGDVPYTEGGKGKTSDILRPIYDTQQSIYEDLIRRLSSSIAVLQNADPALGYPGELDPIFGNDLDKWIRFANSVRLRLGMRLRFADNALSRATVEQCLSAPLMEDNSHDAYIIQTEGNGNPWFNNRTNFPIIKMSTRLIDQLEGTGDPRLPIFVSPDGNGEFTGITNGLTNTAFGQAGFDTKSDIGVPISSQDTRIYMITAAETWFLRAEAALVYDNDPNMANELYRNGVATALSQWEIDPASITGFLESASGSLNGVNDEEQIGVQLWLAVIPNFFEGWTQIRRTGFPVIEQRTADNLEPGVTNGFLPTRFLYSSFELSSNNENVTTAIDRQGPNRIDTPVWWDQN
ncbi:MAG: SusD/RagB family nutrient-binding outer membrane lipoprotein [Bacteroidota bacterium]